MPLYWPLSFKMLIMMDDRTWVQTTTSGWDCSRCSCSSSAINVWVIRSGE